jgi:ribokinase
LRKRLRVKLLGDKLDHHQQSGNRQDSSDTSVNGKPGRPGGAADSAPRITVLGSINMDLVFSAPRLPGLGETLTGSGFRQVPGGKGANQAVAAARQGGDVRFIGMVGADGFGSASLRALAAEGIDCAAIGTADQPTGVACVMVDDNGANSIVVVAGANAALDVKRVDAASALIDAGDWLICQLESPIDSVAAAFELARAGGARIVFNPAPVPAAPLPDSLIGVDYLVVNETEAGQLTDLAVADAASATKAATVLRSRGAGTVLVTMGAQGVLVADGVAADRFLPALVVDAVDTTAAGDTFVGALTVALGRGLAVDEAVGEAQAAAAVSVTRMGAQSSIPTRAEMLQLRFGSSGNTPGHVHEYAAATGEPSTLR